MYRIDTVEGLHSKLLGELKSIVHTELMRQFKQIEGKEAQQAAVVCELMVQRLIKMLLANLEVCADTAFTKTVQHLFERECNVATSGFAQCVSIGNSK